MNNGVGYQRLVTGLLAVVAMFAGSVALADGTTERERTMSRYAKCKWTDAMSKELYECVKRNNGFNTHWCFDETLQTNCEPEPLAVAAENPTTAERSVSQEEERKRAARQGEENLRINRSRYEEQVGTATDVVDAQTLLTRARTDYHQAVFEYQVSLARLRRAAGIL